jgi:hypothetical protein
MINIIIISHLIKHYYNFSKLISHLNSYKSIQEHKIKLIFFFNLNLLLWEYKNTRTPPKIFILSNHKTIHLSKC